ncbi:type IV secretory system conjugative DNA transfer family protein [Streptomyces griseorubiginosus]|uniref:type IV secretory system conjugative DNA transfer family protein n=1 Tax=Streptomyces griseorubiginosus TaxID=67304 RepID=UPI00340B36D3
MSQTYRLHFPSDLDADQVGTWLTAVSGTLTTGPRRLLNVSSMVFEVEATEAGIQYRLVVPEGTADFLTSQLRTLVPGSTATPAGTDDAAHQWTLAVELGQTNPRRSLGTVNPKAISASLLASLQGLGRGEALLLQWAVSPALRQRPPVEREEGMARRSMGHALGGRNDRDRINDIRTKLSEPNFLGVLRVAVQAPSKERGEHLLARVRASLRAVGSSSNRLKQRLMTSGRVISRVHERAVPTLFPMQLAGSELVGLIAWPIGSPHVAGLPQGRTRQLAATGTIPRTGRVIAHSNFPGAERLLALSPEESTWHMQVVGPTGSGKTALLTNLISQDMNAGRGVILIEGKGDLFQAVLDRVPERRLQDVVLLDVSDTDYPVGFNILQGIDDRMRSSHFQPLMDRIWQLNNRPSIRNIIGQSQRTIDLQGVIRENKILLVNLGRATEGKDTAGLLGSLLLNAVWSVVQTGAANPARPTMLYLDEFQDFINLPIAPGDMFAQARSLGLAMTVAHQHLGQLTRELQDATQNNARSTVVFQTSADEARSFARQFGRSVTDEDFMNQRRFEVLMRLATEDGVSVPVTGVTLPPVDPTGFDDEVRRWSRRTYGRPVAEVEAEIKQRRGQQPAASSPTRRPRFGGPR